MGAPALHTITISFHKNNQLVPTFHYSGPNEGKILFLPEGDKLKIEFKYLDDTTQPTIVTAILNAIGVPPSQPGAPFKEGLHVNLPPTRILTGGSTPGHWEFTVTFEVNWPTGPLKYFLPDPELQVGPKPGGCDGL
jgi:hypothetical protein